MYEGKYFRAAISIAFHALLSVGEITLQKGNTNQKLIEYVDVSLQENKVILNIRYSKTDQLGFIRYNFGYSSIQKHTLSIFSNSGLLVSKGKNA